MKVIVEYEPNSGNITDSTGCLVGTFFSLKPFDEDQKSNATIGELVKLKEAGFTVDEIVTLKDRKLV